MTCHVGKQKVTSSPAVSGSLALWLRYLTHVAVEPFGLLVFVDFNTHVAEEPFGLLIFVALLRPKC